MLAVVASDGTVCGLGLEGLSIGGDEDRGHETERSETLGDDIRLHITIVVLHGDDEATLGLDHLGDHVVNETVLVPDTLGLELVLELLVVDFLEDVLEATIVTLEDSVFGRHVERVVLLEGEGKGGVGKTADGLVGVVHGETDTRSLEVKDGLRGRRGAIGGGEGELKLAGAGEDDVGGLILVTMGVTTDDDGFSPAGDETRDDGDDNGLTEDGTAEDITDSAVGGEPHLLELELFDAGLVGGDGGAFHTDGVFQDGLGGVSSHFVVSLVTVFDAEIVVLEVDIEVGKDELARES